MQKSANLELPYFVKLFYCIHISKNHFWPRPTEKHENCSNPKKYIFSVQNFYLIRYNYCEKMTLGHLKFAILSALHHR